MAKLVTGYIYPSRGSLVRAVHDRATGEGRSDKNKAGERLPIERVAVDVSKVRSSVHQLRRILRANHKNVVGRSVGRVVNRSSAVERGG